jgi:hypothetical protein
MKKTLSPSPLLGGEVDVRKLLDRLEFSEGNLIEAAGEQAKLFYEATRLRTQKMRKRLHQEHLGDILRAQLSLEARSEFMAAGERFTTADLNSSVLSTPEWGEHIRLLEKALAVEDAAKMLVEAYRHRKEALRVILDQNRAELGLTRKAVEIFNLHDIQRQLKKKYPGMEDSHDD